MIYQQKARFYCPGGISNE